MPAQTLLLLVEGPHDLEFCARLLGFGGFMRVRKISDLESGVLNFWHKTVPRQWPHGDDLLTRHPVPLFLANSPGQSVAIVNANGLNSIAKRLRNTLEILDRPPDSIGVLLDSDDAATPQKRLNEFYIEVAKLPEVSVHGLQWPPVPGAVQEGPPRTGAFVIPDNRSQGTLEDLLLDAANLVYPKLLLEAKDFVDKARQDPSLNSKDLSEIGKPAGVKKVTTAAIGNFLRPGKAIQVSIQENRWLEADSLQLPRIKALHQFLEALLE